MVEELWQGIITSIVRVGVDLVEVGEGGVVVVVIFLVVESSVVAASTVVWCSLNLLDDG